MIRSLRVTNLAVIEEIELELGPGLNVFTGETGAGKSLLLEAIAALRGQRISSQGIRSGAESATVEAIFDAPPLLARARALGLMDASSSELLVARTITHQGRGKVYVNGSLATVSLLAQLLQDQLEIVGQGEHQRLLRPEVQSSLLDGFGGLTSRVEDLGKLHAKWCEVAREIHARRAQAGERMRRQDQLRFELEQIEAIDPVPGELESLEAELARLGHVDRLAHEIGGALERLEGEAGIRERLALAQRQLDTGLELDASLAPSAEALRRAELELAEAAALLERYLASLESDPARLERVELRLGELRRLQTRYGPDLEAILAYRDQARAELERIGGGAERTVALESELDELAQDLDRAAAWLEQARREAAVRLEADLKRELVAVDLGRAQLRVRFDPLSGKTPEGWQAPCAAHGRERASYWLAANPGEEPRRLRDAASGGELARLLLALRNVLRDEEERSVLLFDEIDAGISGRAARRVGERLQALAVRHQILCITHLPQIAALGARHYRIRKRKHGGRVRAQIQTLEGEARIEEIAHMAAGGRVTEVARAHARELLSP